MTITIEVCDGKLVGYETTTEFAKRLGVPPATVRNWIKRGKLDIFQIERLHWVKEGTPWPEQKKRGRKKGA